MNENRTKFSQSPRIFEEDEVGHGADEVVKAMIALTQADAAEQPSGTGGVATCVAEAIATIRVTEACIASGVAAGIKNLVKQPCLSRTAG
jgi:hypothetical protein